MASSILSSSLSFLLISNGNVASTPKPSSFFFPPSNTSALRSPTKISASSPPSQPPPDSSDSYPPAETDENVSFTLALARARERTKNQLADKPVVQNASAGSEESKNNRDIDVPLSVKLALKKAREYKKNEGLAGTGGNAAEKQTLSDFSGKKKTGGMPAGLSTPVDPFPDGDFPEVEIIVGDTSKFGDGGASEPKLSKEGHRSGLYKLKVSSWGASSSPSNISKTNAAATDEMKSDGSGDVPLSFQLAMEKAKECKKNKGLTNAGGNAPEKQAVLGSQEMKLANQRDSAVEKKEKPRTSSIDFLGLDFSEKKKTRGMPAGLVTPLDPFPDGDFPEVEIIVGDPSKFGDGSASKTKLTTEDEGSGLYKPKVTSWGASPSATNISNKNVAVTEEKKSNSNGDIPHSFQLAMENAKEYKKNKRLTNAGGNAPEKQAVLGSQEVKLDYQKDSVVEKKEEPKTSSIDFLGLDFSEKKKARGMPAGLLAPLDTFADGDFPEVEIIVGDPSKFGDGSKSKTNVTMEDEDSGFYKPKVTSWGASPSPSNISKTNAAVTEEMKSDSNGDIPLSFQLAMEKAKEFKKNKGVTYAGGNAPEKQTVLADGIILSQSKHVLDILCETNMDDSNGVLMSSSQLLTCDDGPCRRDETAYRKVLGKLQYLTFTRPDISYSVNKLSQFMHSPSETHWKALKRVLRYLKQTAYHGLLISSNQDKNLYMLLDADWASDPNARASKTGYILYFNDSPVNWLSKKQ